MKKWMKQTAMLVLVVLIQACNPPSANFVFSNTLPHVGEIVHLNDRSLYEPNAWEWSIDPPNINFHDGTDLDSKNPSIVFKTGGVYCVTLQVWNSHGTDTQKKCIKVLNWKN